MSEANTRQVAGDHYQSTLQHWDVIIDNYGPSYLIACATKYITRWRKKNGVQDLTKADHYVQKLQEWATSNSMWDWDQPIELSVVIEFMHANKLEPVEAEIIETLFGCWNLGQLAHVRGLIKSLIQEKEKEF